MTATAGPAAQDGIAAGFAEVAGADEKMHIHFVDPETVAPII